MKLNHRDVLYGTPFAHGSRRNVLAELPNLTFDSIVNSPFVSPETRCTRHDYLPENVRLPSVTYINQCVHPKETLCKWQSKKKNELGASFSQWSIDLMNAGTRTHREIEKILEEFQKSGKIEQSDEEIISSVTAPKVEMQDRVRSFMKSILPFLRKNLIYDEKMRIEESVVHNGLYYTGRFDAICSLGGEGLMLVDWKTVSQASLDGGVSDAELYGYPSQLAAYVGAINADPKFEDLGSIAKAADVLIYEDERPAEMVVYQGEELQMYWEEWLQKLNKYWWTMKNYEGDKVDFTYKPPESTLDE
ncbi:hypothetical protein QR680_006626 [Steinernema hermaphroditum]|uniref:PD-(D/E)XK endonuclease-like domain-containing protein n=1 Tax=Steinernema hermaphroditum TaxID=289476 RepID=A0AA39LXQ5_9BILA|nr:hypothetical protein QR680_006626 [Steinernema hermaphroditum]